MPAGPFTISKDFMHGTKEGCLRVTAVPHIILYRIPRDFASNLTAESELKQAGIYLLMNTVANTIYVGQADSRDNGNGVLGRMLEPHTKKNEIDKWDVGYVLTNGTPTFFGATELNWLEQFFYDEAMKAGRYTVLNGNRPHANEVSFSTRTLLNSYVDFAFFLLEEELHCDAFEPVKKTTSRPHKQKMAVQKDDSVGEIQSVTDSQDHSVVELQRASDLKDNNMASPQVTSSSQSSTVLLDNSVAEILHSTTTEENNETCSEPFFIHNDSKDAHAEAVRTDDNKMIVKKGSRISQSSNLANQKGQDSKEKLRNQLISDGTIKDRIFTVDHQFSTPSAAACVILGTSSSGNEKWINQDGVTLGEILGKKEE